MSWGSITELCDVDACGHPLLSCPSCAVSQKSFRAQTLLSLHERQDHNNKEKGDEETELSYPSVKFSHVHVRALWA